MSIKANNYPRQLRSGMETAMQDTPIVLINGPRQSGKTTLVKEYSPSLPYYTLDDDNILNAAKQDPVGFVNRLLGDEMSTAPSDGVYKSRKVSFDNFQLLLYCRTLDNMLYLAYYVIIKGA